MRKLKKYIPTKFKAKDSHYDKEAADIAVMFIEQLCHTKGIWAGEKFELIDWQEQIIRDLFGILKPNGLIISRYFLPKSIEWLDKYPIKVDKFGLASEEVLELFSKYFNTIECFVNNECVYYVGRKRKWK